MKKIELKKEPKVEERGAIQEEAKAKAKAKAKEER